MIPNSLPMVGFLRDFIEWYPGFLDEASSHDPSIRKSNGFRSRKSNPSEERPSEPNDLLFKSDGSYLNRRTIVPVHGTSICVKCFAGELETKIRELGNEHFEKTQAGVKPYYHLLPSLSPPDLPLSSAIPHYDLLVNAFEFTLGRSVGSAEFPSQDMKVIAKLSYVQPQGSNGRLIFKVSKVYTFYSMPNLVVESDGNEERKSGAITWLPHPLGEDHGYIQLDRRDSGEAYFFRGHERYATLQLMRVSYKSGENGSPASIAYLLAAPVTLNFKELEQDLNDETRVTFFEMLRFAHRPDSAMRHYRILQAKC